jgi:hypothetical protein
VEASAGWVLLRLVPIVPPSPHARPPPPRVGAASQGRLLWPQGPPQRSQPRVAVSFTTQGHRLLHLPRRVAVADSCTQSPPVRATAYQGFVVCTVVHEPKIVPCLSCVCAVSSHYQFFYKWEVTSSTTYNSFLYSSWKLLTIGKMGVYDHLQDMCSCNK